MNYNLNINEVDLAAFLIALGFEMQNYTVTSTIDFNQNNKRYKSGAWIFSDYSIYKELGDCTNVLKKYKLPEKGERPKNIAEYAKLTAHNYQVLKSVLTENKPLKQIIGSGYTMLKNENGDFIPISKESFYKLDETRDLMNVAIACALGCRVANYFFNEKRELVVCLYPSTDGITPILIEKEKQNPAVEDETNFNLLPVLIAYSINRKELLKGVYQNEKIRIIRGSKQGIFNKNASEEIKERIIKELNA